MEIWTTLKAQAPHRTAIQVDFHIPHLSEQNAKKLGDHMTTLYTSLWDEDERMMQKRQIALDARHEAPGAEPLDLGPTATLLARLPLTLTWGDSEICIVETDGKAREQTGTEVRIVQNNVGRLSSQFQKDFFNSLGRTRHDVLADGSRPSKGHHVDTGVTH